MNPTPALIHKPVFGLFLLAVVAEIVRTWLGLQWPGNWAWIGPGIWVLAAGTLAVGLARPPRVRQLLVLQQVKPNLKHQLMLSAHQLQLLNLPAHQYLTLFQIPGMESQYLLCQLKPQAVPHRLQLHLQPS